MHPSRFRAAFSKPSVKATLLLVLIGLLVAPASYAIDFEKFLTETLWSGLIWPFAQLLNFLVVVLIKVATYNGFANEPLVIKGWTLTRNVANMFFVFILLIIAIGTIVKWQVMNYRQNLRRLILMALLINFSRTITVFLIDLSQVIVLTFLTAVQDALQGGVITMLGIDTVISNVGSQAGAAAGGAIGVVTFIIAAIMVLIAAIVVGVIVIVLVARIIALWGTIITAPLAFLASTIPQTDKYYKQWWEILGKNVASGPILAFFLWLTFAVVADQGGGSISNDPSLGGAGKFLSIGGIDGTAIINFIVGIGMLVFSIRLAGQVGGAGGAMAQKFGNAGLKPFKDAGKFAVQRAAWGKSGQGGVLGRAKSGALAATAAIASGLSRASIAPTGFIARSATIAREKQKQTRKKAEAERLQYLPEQMQREFGRSRYMDIPGLRNIPGFRGIRAASAPARLALQEAQVRRINERDERGVHVVSRPAAIGMREEYVRSGASEQELRDYDVKTNLRGLRTGDENIDGAAHNPQLAARDAARAREMMVEMLPQGLSRDVITSFSDIAGQISPHQSTSGQMESQYEKLGPTERREFITSLIRAYGDAQNEAVRLRATGDIAGADNADRRASRVKTAVTNMNAQQSIDNNLIGRLNPTTGLFEQRLNEAATRMKESSHNDLDLTWLQNNQDEILDLTGANLRRFMVSNTLSDDKKEHIMRVVLDGEAGGDVRAQGLTEAMEGPELTRSIINEYRRVLARPRSGGGTPPPPPPPGRRRSRRRL